MIKTHRELITPTFVEYQDRLCVVKALFDSVDKAFSTSFRGEIKVTELFISKLIDYLTYEDEHIFGTHSLNELAKYLDYSNADGAMVDPAQSTLVIDTIMVLIANGLPYDTYMESPEDTDKDNECALPEHLSPLNSGFKSNYCGEE